MNTQTIPTLSLLWLSLILGGMLTGCSAFSISDHTPKNLVKALTDKPSTHEETEIGSAIQKVANPPAKTLRFDGHEIVLGQSESVSWAPDKISSEIAIQLQEQRFQTATSLILRHRESAERMLFERWSTGANDPVVQFAAKTLDRRALPSERGWSSLIEHAKGHPAAAARFQELRNRFALELQSQDPSNEAAEQLLQAAIKISHPLPRIDALRLLGLRELVASRHAWAESQFRQAIETATNSGHPMIAAELWLTLAEAARRSGQPSIASSAWSNAVQLHLSAIKPDQPVDVQFWLLAEKTRPETQAWPSELVESLQPYLKQLGYSTENSCDVALWTAVANAQLLRGEWQSALVNFKKAETLSEQSNAQWLRIAQAHCLAAMGQVPSASAILSGPAANTDVTIAAAATAALGNIKLRSGAYQQGAQLLHKALTLAPTSNWPTKPQALADLATAQLILGDTETGLKALHEAQQLLEKAGQREALVRSLENEIRLLEHENRGQESREVKMKVIRLERL